MLQIIIPMAGQGQRFADAGYRLPKPLIDVEGRPMIARVIANLRPDRPHRFVFVCQQAHLAPPSSLASRLAGLAPGCAVVAVPGITQGAACTVLAARHHLNRDLPLLIANCDQLIEADITPMLDRLADHDACFMTMPSADPKYSYAALSDDGLVAQVAEKQVISAHATTGLYAFARAAWFLDGADAMIRRGLRSRGEFYVAPVGNLLVEAGRRIAIHEIAAPRMHCLGTPEDLAAYLARPALVAA